MAKYLEEFKKFTREEILQQRKEKFLNIGKQEVFTVFSKPTNWLTKDNLFGTFKELLNKFKRELIIVIALVLTVGFFIF